MIRISNLKKSFGEVVACDIDALTIKSNEIIGLVGNNGAGKTTLFRLILDLLKPDEGSVCLSGNNGNETVEVRVNESEEWKTYTGAFIDDGFLIDFLTADEYLDFIGKISGMTPQEVKERKDYFSEFAADELFGNDKLIRNLSAGNKQKVGIISALFNKPEIVILDEPFNFLDPSTQKRLKGLIEEYRKETGATIIISSHNLTHTVDVSTRVLLLESGKIIQDIDNSNGEAVDILNDYFQ